MGFPLFQVVEGPGGGDHCAVVGAVGELREEGVDPAFLPAACEPFSLWLLHHEFTQ